MENNNILIIQEGSNPDVISQFKRVNLDEPATILSYCSDIKDQINAILDSTAQMSISSEEIILDETTISSIASFDESLDDSERAKNKKELAVVKGIKSLLANIGVDKFEEEEKMKTYKGRYEEYCRAIGKVVEAVEQQKQASLNDIGLRNSIIQEVTPLIEQLELMIKVGYQDKLEYDAQTEKLRHVQPQTIDTEHLIGYRTQLSEIFNSKLNELEKGLVLYKEQIQTYRMQQRTDMQLTMEADSYIRDQAPILRAQGSVMVFNRQQSDRIARLKGLNAKTNEAISNNARQLEQNVAATVELSLNQGISIDTLKTVDQSLKRGIELFKSGRVQKQKQIAAHKVTLEALNSSLNSYQQEVLDLIEEESAVLNVLGDSPNLKKTKNNKR